MARKKVLKLNAFPAGAIGRFLSALLCLLGLAINVLGAVPEGTDKSVVIDEDVPYLFTAADFGFSDPGDVPPNAFSRVGITTLPSAGSLTIDGIPVLAGESVSLSPTARMGWTARESNRHWRAIVSSADGTRLAAITLGSGPVFTSLDAGVTWTPRGPNLAWNCIASSADGTKLVAGIESGPLQTSIDGGVTWTPRGSNRFWTSVASSADGVKLVAAELDGSLYVSSDSGVSWTPRGAGTGWTSVASSSDGTKLAAVPREAGGYNIHISTDSGLTWQPRGPAKPWLSVISSADGSMLLGRINGSPPLQISRDAGETWTACGPDLYWADMACSADGMKLVAVPSLGSSFGQNNRIHTSSDGGITWYPCESPRGWRCVASSADSLQLIAGASGSSAGKLYTSVAAVPQLTFTPVAQAFGTPYASFTFQVQDDGLSGFSRDPSPNQFSFAVNSVNDAPLLVIDLTDGLVNERGTLNYTMQNNRFRDVEDGLALTYSVTRADGSPIPAWLEFNPATRVFRGSPGSADTGILNLTVTARDNGNPPLSTDAPFRIMVSNLDDPPAGKDGAAVYQADTPLQINPADFGFSDPLDIPANLFTRVKLTTLPLSGTLSVNGLPLTAGSFFTVQDLPVGNLWTPRESSRVWYGIASSADGLRLAATVNNGRIYTSTDAGVNWTPRESARNWYGIASSSDGEKLVAVAGAVTPSQIYTSTDAGVTWTPRESARNWRAVASSSDGTKLAAGVTTGFIYTSTDSGVTWTQRGISSPWYSIASSADGTKLAAVGLNTQIHTSLDSGVTWTTRESVRSWRSIASSSDGVRLAAVVDGGLIYTSTDAGLTWTPRETVRSWYAITSSADGLKLAAAVPDGNIHTSSDGGVTWTKRASQQNWRAIASSSDGNRLAAGIINGQIFTSAPAASQSLTYTPVPGGGSAPDQFTFQTEDSGGFGVNLDPTPNVFTLNISSPFTDWASANGLSSNPAASNGINLLRFAFGLNADGSQNGPILVQNGNIVTPGWPALLPTVTTGAGQNTFLVKFGRRKSGATCTVQFSADLASWENSSAAPLVEADDGQVQACSTPFPLTLGDGRAPRFFRLSVTSP